MHVGWIPVGVIILAIVGAGYVIGSMTMEPISLPVAPRRRRSRLRLAMAAVVTLALAGSIYSMVKPAKVFGVKSYAIAESLRGELKGPVGFINCRSEPGQLWICKVEGDPGSGGPIWSYELAASGGCWQGERGHRKSRSEQKLSTCLGFSDYLAL
jgi:hypothetical protein